MVGGGPEVRVYFYAESTADAFALNCMVVTVGRNDHLPGSRLISNLFSGNMLFGCDPF